MAKYKKSARGHRSSTADKEKDKKSLLKVFQKRLNSPGFVYQSPSTDESLDTNVPNQRKTAESEIILVMDSSSASDKENKKTKSTKSMHKVKKWKSRSERNKHRSSKKTKTEASTKDSKEKTEFKHHLKMAHQVMNVNPVVPNTKVITQNRLTRRLGLFNQGKASEFIGRESLIVTESVQRQTDVHLRQILGGAHHSDKSDHMPPVLDAAQDEAQDTVSSVVPREVKSRLRSRTTRSSTRTPVPSSDRSAISLPSTPADSMMDVRPDCSSPRPLCESPAGLPESPDIAEIAADLLRSFKPCAIFPNRDLVQETTEDLKKMLRLNKPLTIDAPAITPKYVTPKSVTPSVQMYPEIALRGSMSSETVSRGEGDGHSAHRDMDITSKPGGLHVGSGDYHTEPVRPVTHGGGDNNKQYPIEKNEFSMPPEIDNRVVPHEKQSDGVSFEPLFMTDLEIKALSDGRALLALNDHLSMSQDCQSNQENQQDQCLFQHTDHGLKRSDNHGLSQSHGLSRSEHHGLSRSEHHGLPRSEHHGLPRSEHHGLPRSEHHGLPRSEHHGLPRSEHHGLPRESHLDPAFIQGYDMARQHQYHGTRSLHSPMDMTFDQPRVQQLISRPTQYKKCAVEMIQPPRYMPSHPGDLYNRHHQKIDSFHSFYPSAQCIESMDILEAIDRDVMPHNSSHLVTDTDATQCRCRKKHRFLLTGSPDSDGSPMWYAALPLVPPKPPRSPSPSIKLYPRRLY